MRTFVHRSRKGAFVAMGMKHENPHLAELYRADIRSGEVVEITRDKITIEGDFRPGESITLRPGTRVYILTEAEAIFVADGGCRA